MHTMQLAYRFILDLLNSWVDRFSGGPVIAVITACGLLSKNSIPLTLRRVLFGLLSVGSVLAVGVALEGKNEAFESEHNKAVQLQTAKTQLQTENRQLKDKIAELQRANKAEKAKAAWALAAAKNAMDTHSGPVPSLHDSQSMPAGAEASECAVEAGRSGPSAPATSLELGNLSNAGKPSKDLSTAERPAATEKPKFNVPLAITCGVVHTPHCLDTGTITSRPLGVPQQ